MLVRAKKARYPYVRKIGKTCLEWLTNKGFILLLGKYRKWNAQELFCTKSLFLKYFGRSGF